MPYYAVRLRSTDGRVEEVQKLPLMSFEQLQKFLADHPQYEHVIETPGMVKVN